MNKIENQFYTDMMNNRFENGGELGFWIEDESVKVGFCWVEIFMNEYDNDYFNIRTENELRLSDYHSISEYLIKTNHKFAFNSQIAFDGNFQTWEEYSTRLDKLNRLSEVTEDSFEINSNTSNELITDILLSCLNGLVKRENSEMIGDDYCRITVEYFKCEEE